MSLLYLTQQGTRLQKEHGRFVLSRPDRTDVAIPMTEVEQVMVFGNISLTTPTIAACLSRHIPVVFLSQSGTYRGHLWSAEYDDHRAEAAQFARRDDVVFQWAIAQAIVQGKAWNSKQLLLKLNRRRPSDLVETAVGRIDRDLEAIASLTATETSLDQLRGHEGAIAAHYFPALGQLITNANFSLTTRVRRPPTDPVNALLSFGYMLLFNNVLSLLHLEGLNPYLGNLHRSDRHEAHLAFDLMEEFRSPIVDALVLTLLNQQVFKSDDFLPPKANGAVYLNDIPDNRRRYRLSKLLEGHGRRVQESVFECFLTQVEMERLYQQIAGRLNPGEDNVRIYWIPPKAMAKTKTIGSAKPEPPPSSYIY